MRLRVNIQDITPVPSVLPLVSSSRNDRNVHLRKYSIFKNQNTTFTESSPIRKFNSFTTP